MTEPRRRLALSVRTQRLLNVFLAESLGVSWERVHGAIEVLEHALSPEWEAPIADKLGHPDADSYGDLVPTVDGRVVGKPAKRLSALAAGTAGVVVRVSDTDPGKLRYPSARGSTLGDRIEVVERLPFGGWLSARVINKLHAMGTELAAIMRVGEDQ